jgi:hypothetical protein
VRWRHVEGFGWRAIGTDRERWRRDGNFEYGKRHE